MIDQLTQFCQHIGRYNQTFTPPPENIGSLHLPYPQSPPPYFLTAAVCGTAGQCASVAPQERGSRGAQAKPGLVSALELYCADGGSKAAGRVVDCCCHSEAWQPRGFQHSKGRDEPVGDWHKSLMLQPTACFTCRLQAQMLHHDTHTCLW